MKYQQSDILKKISFCLILLFLGLISASVAHAEAYMFATKWGFEGSGDGQFDIPMDIDIDSSGNIYVVEYGNCRIQKFDNNGSFITKWGSKGSGDGQFNDPASIAVDSSGNVYVADSGNNRIQKFDSNGAYITEWVFPSSYYVSFTPLDVAVDPSGGVYVSHWANNFIEKFDSNGNFITRWGSEGSGDGQFKGPSGIAVDSSGNIYVAESGNCRIQEFDSNGNFIAIWGSEGSGDGQFTYPFCIAVDSSGNVYVLNWGDQRIQKFDGSSNFITKWGSLGSGDGQLSYARGITVDSSGNVYVADTDNDRIQKFVLDKRISPEITWNNPADIISGTALNSTQLNASASVAGTFVYTPPSGTVLSAGTHTLHVDFTPADTANYITASKDVTINVLTPEQKIEQTKTTVQDLVTSGVLSNGQGQSLTIKLDKATAYLSTENTKKAINELNKFIKEINTDMKTGKIPSTEGQALIERANSIINAIK